MTKRYTVDNPTLYLPGGSTARYEPGTHVMVMAEVYDAALAALEMAEKALEHVAEHAHYAIDTGALIRAALAECKKVRGE